MRVIHIVPTIRRTDGGIGSAAVDLADHLAAAGVDSTVVTAGFDLSPAELFTPRNTAVKLHFARISNSYGLRGMWSRAFKDAVEHVDPRDAVVHVHGLWIGTVCRAHLAAASFGCPSVLSPHGMLNRWAVRRSPVKKAVAAALFQYRASRSLDAVVGSSAEELQIMRKIWPSLRTWIIPFGVPAATEKLHDVQKTDEIVFMGRIHPVKGLANLLRAWPVMPAHWRLRIVGPDPDRYSETLKRLAADIGISARVSFDPPVYADAKDRMFAQAAVFVLPSHSENFSIATAEALQRGVPVLVSKNCPWSVVDLAKCGWWVENDVSSLRAALAAVAATPPAERAAMGRRGEALIRNAYEWDQVIPKFIEMYSTLRHRSRRVGSTPSI